MPAVNTRVPALRDVLEPWCATGATGAIRLLDPPGGAVYLVDGKVAHAECPVAAGLQRLLTRSGRVPAEAWRTALASGRSQHRVAQELVEAGLMSASELQATTVLALHDAALLLFDARIRVRFEPGVRHPLGPAGAYDLATLCHEVDRRTRVLTDAWPDGDVDVTAVLPRRRLPEQCVALTALQWEVVANANRRRSPPALARVLGYDTFSVLLEVRRMVRAGLVTSGLPCRSATAGALRALRVTPPAPLPAPALPPQPRPAAVRARAPVPLPHRPAPAIPYDEPRPQEPEDWLSEDLLLRLISGLEALR